MADFAIVLWAWKPKGRGPKGRIHYGPALANMQAKAIRRNMSLPHEIVCVTDYPAHEFDSSIRLVDATEHFSELAEAGGCYRRLKAFDPSMKELFAPRFVWMDLDMLVIRDLAPLFDHPFPIRCWKSESLSGQPINGSMLQMDAGVAAHIWRDFDVTRTPAAARMQGYRGTDQAIIALGLGQDVPLWTWRDGVMHIQRNCTRLAVPDIARVVFFPGGAKMTDPVVQHRYPWIRGYLQEDAPEGLPAWDVGEWSDRHPDDKPRYYRAPWRRMQEIRQQMKAQQLKERQARRPA